MSLNTAAYHRNCFNYWPVEDSLIGRTVAVVGNKNAVLSRPLHLSEYPHAFWAPVNNYYSFSRIRFSCFKNIGIKNKLLSFSCSIKIPAAYLEFIKQEQYPAAVFIAIQDDNDRIISYERSNFDIKDISGSDIEYDISCPVNDFKPGYKFSIAISTCMPGIFTMNSQRLP
jgi:hypothetical protein